jgi:phosphogluconate dehydratase
MTRPLNPVVAEVTARIVERSRDSRAAYLERIAAARAAGPGRQHLSCGNLAHAYAGVPVGDKLVLRTEAPNLGIVTAYNDMLSSHQPFEGFPAVIKDAARRAGGTAQVAGGVPAMCDGVTQGRPGMELSLFSRDVIALATGVALSHDVFDAALMLGVCDKIVPGLMIGALAFGHLPVLFVPAGPMPSGIPNKEKAKVRERYALGEATRAELLEAESASYHSPGTCTFYGTANSNQVMMELMGVHVPGTAFVNPGTPLREALTRAAATRAVALARDGEAPLASVIDERAVVNAIVGLMATGGSTNHALHIPAMARAAGIVVNWDDFDALGKVTPLLARIYPNGAADVNMFQAAGGTAFLIRELIDAGLAHADVTTVAGVGLAAYARDPVLEDGALVWRDAVPQSLAPDILRPASDPFDAEGGLKVLHGPLGRAVIKISAVPAHHRVVEAPAAVFDDQDAVLAAFSAGKLDRDVIVVLRFQGPRANGMPELHKLTPPLTALQNKGFRVGLVTDGRMSGASGAVPAAIHVTPEAFAGGLIGRIEEGDIVRIDSAAGALTVAVNEATLAARPAPPAPPERHGWGRDLFGPFRAIVGAAEAGGGIFGP